jgi:hypothetical protein
MIEKAPSYICGGEDQKSKATIAKNNNKVVDKLLQTIYR